MGCRGGGGWDQAQPHNLPLPQCSRVAGICRNILSCSPGELLEQRAVLEQVQLGEPSVSPDLLLSLLSP